MYAIVKTGGKQYRVEQGQSLLVERLPASDGDSVELQPLLVVDGSDVVDGEGLSGVTVSARVLGHERGPKLRVVKFKPKRGYKRRTGHRQELTRIEITAIEAGASGSRGRSRKTEGASGSRSRAGAGSSEKRADAAEKRADAAEGAGAARASRSARSARPSKPTSKEGDDGS